MTLQKEWWTSSSGLVEIEIPVDAIDECTHPGQCDEDVEYWYTKIDWANVKRADMERELRGYGAWDDLDTVDINTLKQRITWIACGDLAEGN